MSDNDRIIDGDNVRGDLGKMVRSLCAKFSLNFDDVRGYLYRAFPALNDKEHCPNCGASMVVDEYRPDFTDSELLIAMGKKVRENQKKGMVFTDANLVHVYTLPVSDATRHRTTRCSYLNYIKQPEGQKNKGMYVITQWGFAALRGEPVPAAVRYFRGELISRSDEKITLGAMRANSRMLKKYLAYKRGATDDYNPNEWRDFGGIENGKLL